MQQQSPYHGLKSLDDAMAEGMERFQAVSQRFRELADLGADQALVQREAQRLGYAPIGTDQNGKMVDYTDMVTRRADMTVGEHLQDVAAGFGRGIANLPADVASLAAIPFQAVGYEGVSNFANKYREGVNELIPTSNKYRTSISEQVGGGLSTIAGAAAGGAGLAKLGVKGATAALASRGLTGEALAAAQRSTFASLAAKKSLQLMTVQGAGAEAGAAQAAGAGAGATILAAAGGAATAQLERFGSVKILGDIFGAGTQAAGRMTGRRAVKSVAGGFAGEIGEELVAAPISTIARSGYETDPFAKRLKEELEGTLKVAPLVILPFTAVHGIRASQMVRRDNELARALPSKLAPRLEGVAEGQIIERQTRSIEDTRADNPELADQLERAGSRMSGPDGKPVKLLSSSAATQRVQALGEAITESGARVVYFEPEGDDAGDIAGFYDKDTATIFINSKQSENVQIMQGMFHELLHDIYQDSPGGLNQIHDRLQAAFGDNYTKFMQKVAKSYPELSGPELTEEYVNNFLAQAMPGYMAMAVTSKDMFKMAAYRDPGLVFDISRILSNFLGRSMDKYTQREQAILAQRMENIANELQGDFAMDPNAAVKVDPMTAVRVAGEVSAAMQQALELRSQAIPEIRRSLENPDVGVSPEGIVRRPAEVERTGGGTGRVTFSDRLVASSVASEGVNNMASKLYPGRTGPKLSSDVYEVVDDPTAEGGGTKLRKIASAGEEYTPQIAADVKDAVSRGALYGEVKFDSSDVVINLAKRVMRLDIPRQYRALGRAIQKVAESTERFAGAEADTGVEAEAEGEPALREQVARLEEKIKSLPEGSPERSTAESQLYIFRNRLADYRRQAAAGNREEEARYTKQRLAQQEREREIVGKILAAEAIVKYGQDYSTLTDEQKDLVRIDAEKRLAGFTGTDTPADMRMPFMRDTSAFKRGFKPERARKPLEARGEEAQREAELLAGTRREAEFEREYSRLQQEEKLQEIATEEELVREAQAEATAKYEQQLAEMEREEAQRMADIAAEELAIMQEMYKEEAKPLSERQGLSDQEKVAMYLMAREVIPTLIAQRKRLPRDQQPPNLRQALKEYFALEDELRRKYPNAEDWKRKRLGKPGRSFEKPTPRKETMPKKGETALQAEIRGKYGSDLETLGEEQRLLVDSRKAIAAIFKSIKDKTDLPRKVGAGAFAPVAEFSKRTAGARSTTGGQRQAPFTSVNGRSLEDIAAEIYTDHAAAQKLRKNRGDKTQVARLEAKIADNLKLLERISNTQKARINKISDIKREVRAKSGIAAPTFGRDKAKPAGTAEVAAEQPAQEQTQAEEQAEAKPEEAAEAQQQQEQEQAQEQEQPAEFDPYFFEPSDDALELLSSEPTRNEAYREAVVEAGREDVPFLSTYLSQDASDAEIDAQEALNEKYDKAMDAYQRSIGQNDLAIQFHQISDPPEAVVAYRVVQSSDLPQLDIIAVNVVTNEVRLVPRSEVANKVTFLNKAYTVFPRSPETEASLKAWAVFAVRLDDMLEDYRRETRGERQQQQQDEEGDEEAPAATSASTGTTATVDEQKQAGIDFLGDESKAGEQVFSGTMAEGIRTGTIIPLPGFGPSSIRIPSGPDGKPMKVEVMYMLVDESAVAPSHKYVDGKFRKNKGGDINERPYDDPEAGKNLRRDFENNLKNFDPAFVLSTDNTAVNGPPVVTARGVVLGGNSRAMMLQSLSEDQRKAYEQALKDTVSSLPYFEGTGYAEDLDFYGGKVLVRVIKPGQQGKPGELSPFLNESFTASREVNARATSRGARLKPETASQLSNVIGDMTMRAALGTPSKSIEIQQLLLGDGVFTERELDALRDKKGQLTDQGRSEVEMAVLGAVVNDVRVMSEVEPSTMQKIVGAVAPLLRIMAADPSSRQSIENAVDVLNYMKANDIRLDELDRQQFAFADKQAWRNDQLAKDLAAIMSQGKLNAAKALSRIAVEAEAAGTNQGDIFAAIEPGKPKLSAAETVREEARQINSREKDERAGEAKTKSGFKPILAQSEIAEGLNLDLDINIQQMTDLARSYESETDPLVKSQIEGNYNRLANLVIKKVKEAQSKNKDAVLKTLYDSIITKVTQRANVANHPRLGDGMPKKGDGNIMFSRRLVETEDERLLRLATRKPEDLLRLSQTSDKGRKEGAGIVGFLNTVYENAVDAEAALRDIERNIAESADAQAKLIAEGKLPSDVERYNYNSTKHAVSDMLDLYRGRIGENNKLAIDFRQQMVDAAKKYDIPISPADAEGTGMVSAEEYLYATHAADANKGIAYDRAEARFDKSERGKEIKKEIRKLRGFVVGERAKSKAFDGKDPDYDKIDEATAKIKELEAERDDTVDAAVKKTYADAKSAAADIARLEKELKAYPDGSPGRRIEVALSEARSLYKESTKDHAGSGMTDAKAQEILDRVNKSESGTKQNAGIQGYKDIRKAMTGLQAAKLKIQIDSNLVDPDTADRWRERYGPNYVPLKSTIRPPDGNGFGATGFSIKGKETESRKGRATLADDLIGHSLVDFSHANSRAMKNVVMNSFVRLVESNSKLGIWEVVGSRKDWEAGLKSGVYDERDNRRIVSVKRTQTYEDPFSGEFATRTVERIVLVNDEGLARAITQMDGIDMGSFTAGAIRATRLFTKMQTAWNPAFILPNFARDVLLGVGIRYTDNGLAASRRLMANLLPAMRTIFAVEMANTAFGKALGLDKIKPGKFDLEYRELRNLGGFSSPVEYGNVTEQMDRIRREASQPKSQYGKAVVSTRAKVGQLFEFIEAINTVVERATRLAAYVELDQTMSEDASRNGKAYSRGSNKAKRAAATKNLTVNFDRRGRAGHILNSLYAFYNANVQGTANLMRRLGPSATPEQRRRSSIAIAFLSMSGYAMSLLARAMSDDDEQGEEAYKGLAADELQKNLVLMIPGAGGTRATIPLPWGMNMAWFAGVQIERMTSGQISAQTAAEEYASGLLGSFSPITGPSASLAIVPTLARPFAEIDANMNYAGNTIMPPVDPYDKTPLPDSRRAYRTVSNRARWVAETLNDFTGGDSRTSGLIDVSPESIEHIAEFMSGGAGRFVQNAFGLDLDREETQIRDIPVAGAIAGRFVRQTDEAQRTVTEYYANTDRVARLRENIKDPATRAEAMNDPIRAVDRYATAIEGRLRKLKQAEKAASAAGNTEVLKNLAQRRIELMQSFNKRYNALAER